MAEIQLNNKTTYKVVESFFESIPHEVGWLLNLGESDFCVGLKTSRGAIVEMYVNKAGIRVDVCNGVDFHLKRLDMRVIDKTTKEGKTFKFLLCCGYTGRTTTTLFFSDEWESIPIPYIQGEE